MPQYVLVILNVFRSLNKTLKAGGHRPTTTWDTTCWLAFWPHQYVLVIKLNSLIQLKLKLHIEHFYLSLSQQLIIVL